MPKPKGKKVMVKKTSNKPSWSDAGILMKVGANPKEIEDQKKIIACAIAFGIPPQGISILADNLYINKIGLEFKFDEHKQAKNWGYFLSKPVELAKQAGDTAVFVTELYDKEGRMIANGYGSANAANIKMGTIKVFLNEMAETRSQNRCLRKVVSPVLYKAFIENVRSLKKDQLTAISEVAGSFGSVSVEEIGASEEETKAENLLSGQEMKDIGSFLQEINNAKNDGELKKIGERIKTGAKVKFNENQIKVLKEAWIGKSQKLAFK
jgi:hypothetical protein